jgi:uncharacterized protein (DUF952 family)
VKIFHIALRSEWEAAQKSGSYTTSTRGVTLADEGFIHASRGDQWQGVHRAFYADADEPLVLLVIDTDRLTSPVVEEVPADGMSETFPHIYGPLNADAVTQAVPLDEHGNTPTDSFSSVFLREMFSNVLLGSMLLGVVVIGAVLGRELGPDWGAVAGAAVGLLVGIPLVVTMHRQVSR